MGINKDTGLTQFRFTYGADNRLLLAAHTPERVAVSLHATVNEPGWSKTSQLECEVEDAKDVRDLFESYLADMGFRLVEGHDANKKLVSLHLIYERNKAV